MSVISVSFPLSSCKPSRYEMITLCCKCLNIKLHVKESEYQIAKEQNLSTDYIPTGFFPSGETEVELDPKGIQQEHGYLVHRRKIGNYMLFRCLNCGVDAYSMHINGSPIVANNDLLNDPTIIERLKHSAEFSKVFNMVLQNKDTQFSGSMPDPNSATYETVQSTLNTIQKQLADFIIQEEADMEDRIREYEETQKTSFQELQTRLKEEKKRMISLLLTSAQFDETEETQRKDSSKRSTNPRKSPAKKQTVSRVKSMPPNFDQDPDDALFSFDGIDTSEETFYNESSSEEEDDAVDGPAVEIPRTRSKNRLTYSTSVPISVPTWSSMQKTDFLDESEDLTPSEPDQIAASMQALAQSITDDNRYIFGERPRPRLNTGDFTGGKR
ncbi:hypothetical protein ACF0H5_015687 [Mactra antiquata]